MGLQYSFPGATIARFAEQQLAAMGIQTNISPVELQDIRGVHIESTTFLAPPALPVSTLFQVEDIELALFPDILSQDLHLAAKAYGGEINAELAAVNPQSVEFSIDQMRLDHIPALGLIPYATLQGRLSTEGVVNNLQQLQNRQAAFPKGELSLILKNVLLYPNKENLDKIGLGLDLPPLSFSEIKVDVEHSNGVVIRQIQLTGTLSGTIAGKIQLNQRSPVKSRVQLQIQVTLDKEFEQSLGVMGRLLGAYKCDDLINIEAIGTMRGFSSVKRRQCS